MRKTKRNIVSLSLDYDEEFEILNCLLQTSKKLRILSMCPHLEVGSGVCHCNETENSLSG